MSTGAAPATVGMLGLGLMGSAMSGMLAAAGYQVVGFDVEPARCREHEDRGGEVADSTAAVAKQCPVIVVSLPNAAISRQACEEAAAAAAPTTLFLDTTTVAASDSQAIAQMMTGRGMRYLDATVSGNAKQAAVGDAVVMVGGPEEDVAEARPVLMAIGRSLHHMGPVGTGSRTKLIVNLALGIHRLAMAEALVMGEQADLDLEVLLEVLKDGAAYSRAMDIWGDRMLAGDHYPPTARIRQSHKDARLIQQQAHEVGSPTWLGSVVRQVLQIAEADGLADADNAAVIEVLRRSVGRGRVDR
jgi:3-hydroxyisobutyrate dehydrogenase-like beta-hydroxyacid dehydrogenase